MTENDQQQTKTVNAEPEKPFQSSAQSEEKTARLKPYRFQPGQSGNPGGKRRETDNFLFEYGNSKKNPSDPNSLTRMQAVVVAAFKTAEGTSVAASRMQTQLMERYYGKVALPIEVSGLENLAERLKQARARVAAEDFAAVEVTAVEVAPDSVG